jgi:hypothetical protein
MTSHPSIKAYRVYDTDSVLIYTSWTLALDNAALLASGIRSLLFLVYEGAPPTDSLTS